MFQNLFEILNGNLVIRDSNTLAGFVSVDLHEQSFKICKVGKIGSLTSKEVLIQILIQFTLQSSYYMAIRCSKKSRMCQLIDIVSF